MSTNRFGEFKKIPIKTIFFFLLVFTQFITVKNIYADAPSDQHPANALWIEPTNIKIKNIGDKFNITIWINVTQKSFAWQITVYYNSSYTNAVNLGYTNGNKSNFFSNYSTQPVIPKINNEQGYILHGETLLGSDERASGFGSLIWIEFNLTDIPPQNRFTLSFSQPYGSETFILENLPPYFDPIPFETIEGVDIDIIEELPEYLYILLIILLVIVPISVGTIYGIRRRKRRQNSHE